MMKNFFFRSQRGFISHLAIWSSLTHVLDAHCCYTQTLSTPFIAAFLPAPVQEDEPKFTVNFNNTSVIEVVRFVSKISGANFLFSESDLAFNVTIVSEEPIAAKNIISALVQILRINGLKLLEQEGNFLITPSGSAVNQIPTIISGDSPSLNPITSPIVTRIFAIKNTDVAALVKLIKPMTSQGSLLDIFEPTQQLIVTDITTNIEKIGTLIKVLDVPYSNLEIESYVAKNSSLEDLVSLTTQILAPFTERSPLILVPQDGTNTIFVISTPPLIERALTILEDLDTPSQMQTDSSNSARNTLYVYKPTYQTPQNTLSFLQNAAQQMPNALNSSLAFAIQNAQSDTATGSLVFVTDPKTWDQLRALLANVDSPTPSEAANSQQSFYTYKITNGSEPYVEAALKKLADTTQDKDLINVISTMHWVADTNSLIFYGSPTALDKVQKVLPTLASSNLQNEPFLYKAINVSINELSAYLSEIVNKTQDKELIEAVENMFAVPENALLVFHTNGTLTAKIKALLISLDTVKDQALKTQLLLYKPKNQTGETLSQDLKELILNFKNSGLQNTALLDALDSMKWVASSQSLVFSGDQASLNRIQTILDSLDTYSIDNSSNQILIYKPSYATQSQFQEALALYTKNLDPSNLSDQILMQVIYNAEWIPESKSFLFKSNAATLSELKDILVSLDSPTGMQTAQSQNFYLYHLQYASGDYILQQLNILASHLPMTDPGTASLIQSIDGLKWIKDNNSLLVTGFTDTVNQVKTLIAEFDVPSAQNTQEQELLKQSDFFIYKPMNLSPEDLQSSLLAMAQDLKDSGLANPNMIQSLTTVKIVSTTNSLLFTGSPDSIGKIRALLPSLDRATGSEIQKLGDITFLIYKIKQAQPEELVSALQVFAENLLMSDLTDMTLATSLRSVKWVKETNSLLFTGPQDTLTQVGNLAEKFDLESPPQTPVERPSTPTFVVYVPKAQTGSELITILYEFMQNLIHSGVSDPNLFDAINHLRFIQKTNSLIISGDSASIEKIQGLLTKFDIPAAGDNASISAIDTANFLIYKLQYHPGLEIQTALKKVGTSLNNSAPEANKALIDAIDSLQWIEVTNSLIGTGESDVLAKLRELILNLDIPLRQVFIEVLVVETTLFNSQNFGLQWGSQLQYLNKTIGAMGNFPSTINKILNNNNIQTGTVDLSNPISYATGVFVLVA